jgi:hypothetical protein
MQTAQTGGRLVKQSSMNEVLTRTSGARQSFAVRRRWVQATAHTILLPRFQCSSCATARESCQSQPEER